MVLVTYDVNTETEKGKKRLRKVAKECQNYGQRVQNSVFECVLEPARLCKLKNRLSEIMDKNTDSIRYYSMGDDWKKRVEHVGAKASIDIEGALIV